MFDSITIYLAGGLIGGLAVSMLLFQKWDLPGLLKKKFHLNSQFKATLFVLGTGLVLALVFVVVMLQFHMPQQIIQAIEGAVIGLNCAILTGIMRPREPAGKADKNGGASLKAGAGNRNASANKGKRSKG